MKYEGYVQNNTPHASTPETHKSHPHHSISKLNSNIILPYMSRFSSLPLRFSEKKEIAVRTAIKLK
jgi:hypothetical protein